MPDVHAGHPSTVRPPGRRPGARGPFWTVALVFGLFLAAAAAPSPLYAVYARTWQLSPLAVTQVFAVYALALLATLLAAGSLSDAVGRRPVILAGTVLHGVALLAFVAADGLPWLVLARVLQGLSTGLVTGAIAASLLELEPTGRPGLGPLTNSVTPTIGLAVGALGSGALVEYAPRPLRSVYLVLLSLFAVATMAMVLVPETVPRRRRPALRLRVGVPASVRPAFVAALPALVAPWALGGFYLSLGPGLLLDLLASTNRLVGGTVIALLCGAGAAASLVLRARPPRTTMVIGCLALVAGVAASSVGILTASAAVFLAGTAVAGAGFGSAFLGAFRALAALAAPDARGALISSVYVVAYLSFSVPAVLGGLLAGEVGLRSAGVAYGGCVALVAAVAVPLSRRSAS